MKRPQHVWIGPFRYRLRKMKPQDGSDEFKGRTYSDVAQIAVLKGLDPLVEREVVLHEIVHALNFHYLRKLIGSAASKRDEELAQVYGIALLGLILDNPELMTWLGMRDEG